MTLPGPARPPMAPPGQQMALPGTVAPVGRMPGPMNMPGMARPAPQQAPQPPDERDPEPPTKTTGRKPSVDPGPSAAILKRLAENNEEIINTLSKVAEGDLASIEMMRAIHAATVGNSQMLAVLLTIVVDLYEAMAQQPRENFLPRWGASLNGGGVSLLLQGLEQQGKG